MFGVAAQVATALRRLNATGRTPITPVPAHKLNVFGKAVESGCLFFGDTMVERHALSAQARSSPCDGHHPGGSPACSGLPSEHGVIYRPNLSPNPHPNPHQARARRHLGPTL